MFNAQIGGEGLLHGNMKKNVTGTQEQKPSKTEFLPTASKTQEALEWHLDSRTVHSTREAKHTVSGRKDCCLLQNGDKISAVFSW